MPAFTGTIDGVTNKGFWTATKDNTAPLEQKLIPKGELWFKATDDVSGGIYMISDNQFVTQIVQTDTGTLDHDGNLLDTSEKVAQYLSTYK